MTRGVYVQGFGKQIRAGVSNFFVLFCFVHVSVENVAPHLPGGMDYTAISPIKLARSAIGSTPTRPILD